MRRVGRTLAAVLAAALWAQAAGAAVTAPGRYVPGEVLVKYKPALDRAGRTAVRATLGAGVVRSFGFIGVDELSVPGFAVEEAVARLRLDPRIEYAEPNLIWTIDTTPNDSRYPEMWQLHNTGQTGGVPGADIHAEEAWARSTGDSTLKIGEIDTGLDYNHPDIAANVWTNPGEIPGNGIDDDGDGYVDDVHGYDFANHDGDPMDDNGHGTHTAGTIAALGNNGIGTVGVVWRAKVVAIKFLDASGSGPTSAAIEAVNYAITVGCRLTSNSWGGGLYSQALHDAIAAAGNAGQLFVAAAGNAGVNTDVTPQYPAAYDLPNIISVAATDNADQLASFSNWGPTSVDLAAPGVDILSLAPGGGYRLLSGTSMATPHVSGAAALLWSRFPAMGAAQVKDRLIRLSDPLPSLAGRCVSGGRLNLALATADPDTIPPGAITDLRLVAPGSNSVALAWTATGDDSTAGTATRYDLRWSTAPITAANVDSAALAPAPAPQPAGSAESARVAELRQLTPYWFAVRARDEFGNPGPLGNVVATTTLGPPRLTLSPLAVNDALATGLTDTRPVTLANDADGTLEWTAPAPVLDLGATPAVATPPGGWPASALVKGETAPPRAAQTDAAGGPDAFGYRWLDSDERAGPVFAWVDIATPANALALTGDDAITAPLPLGFSFPFYGHRFTSVRVCTNGFLSFDNTQPVFLNSGLPGTGAPRDLVAPFWDDLDFGAGVQRAYAAFDGTRYIVAWVGVPRYHDPASVMTFEAILYPSGEIRFQYRAMTGTTTACTVGLQDSTRTVGLLVAFNQAFVKDSLAVRVVPLRQWLGVTPAAGVIAPHASQTVQVGFAAAGLATGTYTGQVRFLTNAPAAPDTGVAASLAVQGAPDLRLGADSLDFGAEVVGGRDTLALVIGNDGVDTLHVRGATADLAVFQPLFGAFTVLPGDARTVQVAFAPDTALVFKGALAIASDDPDHPLTSLPLLGAGADAPRAAATPDTLQGAAVNGADPAAGQVAKTIVIRNTGAAELAWTASAYQGVPAAVTAQSAPSTLKGQSAGGPGTLGDGGPDAFGYRWVDSDAPNGPAYAWEEIADRGTLLFGSADDSTRTGVPLSFPFPFYGRRYTAVNVCTNGWLSFTSRDSTFSDTDLPDAAPGVPRALVAPWWTDLDLRASGGGRAYVWGDTAHAVFEWRNAPHYAIGGNYTFEVVLFADGSLDFAYQNMGTPTDAGTIGLQNEDASVGLRVVHDAAYVHNLLRVHLASRPDWLRLGRTEGKVPAGGTDTLGVTLDARGYADGTERGEVRLATNDVLRPRIVVPCVLHVGFAPEAALPDPRALVAVSVTPLVRLTFPLPGPVGALEPATLRVNGAALPPALPPAADSLGRAQLAYRALDLLPVVPPGDSARVVVTGRLGDLGWFSASTALDVTRPTLAGSPLPAFGAPVRPWSQSVSNPVDLAWSTPAGGATAYDVAFSGDGGGRWAVMGTTARTQFELTAPDTSTHALVEVVARLGDAIVGTFLSAPFVLTPVVVGGGTIPARFALRPLGALPAHAHAGLELAIPAPGRAEVEVFDLRGARVRTLARGDLAPGRYPLEWNGADAAGRPAGAGIYFVRARWRGERTVLRVVLLR